MLANEQIQSLYAFCEKKGVRYYDLQAELVDHLSEAIEQKISENPALHFDAALAEVYKGFGIFGFSHVVGEKEAAMRKMYFNKRRKAFQSYFTFPKIIITVLLFIVLNAPAYFLFGIIDLQGYYKLLCLVAALASVSLFVVFIQKFKKPAKKLLLLKPTSAFGVLGVILQIPNLYYNGIKSLDVNPNNNIWMNVMISGFCLFLIVLALAIYQVHKTAYSEAKEKYPLAFDN